MEVFIMNSIVLSILLGIAGIFIGIGITILINHFRVNSARDKINSYKEKAQKDIKTKVFKPVSTRPYNKLRFLLFLVQKLY